MNFSQYVERLEAIYQEKNESWHSEGSIIESYLPHIAKAIEYNFTIESPLTIGGSGVISLVRDHNLNVLRVLKFPRPKSDQVEFMVELLLKETESLQRLSHQNLIQLVAKGVFETGPIAARRSVPFFIMDYIAGAKNVQEYLLYKKDITERDILAIFEGIINAIEYVHNHEYVHLDINPSNILVSPSGQAILADLGYAKNIKTNTGQTLLGGTPGFIHPDYDFFIKKHTSRKSNEEIHKHDLKQAWDLFGLGKTLLSLLRNIDLGISATLSTYSRRFVKLLACRLLDGHNQETETTLGITIDVFTQIKYKHITYAKLDFHKLIGAHDLTKVIPELDYYSTDRVQLIPNIPTPFTERVKKTIASPAFSRLDNITQLGLINLIFPGAKHSRFVHSLGTFSIACRIVASLYHDHLNPLFKQLMNEDDLKSVLLAALLHDVGQYPLAHDLEEAELEMFKHERLTKVILETNEDLRAVIINQWGINPSRIVEILKNDNEESLNNITNNILHAIVDGPFDADKLDYLIRDSRSCGLLHAEGLDIQRLITCFSVVSKKDDDTETTIVSLGVHEKGKIAAEDVAWLRYKMFGIVYWHHTYRAIKAMLHRSVWEYLEHAKRSDRHYRKSIQERFENFILNQKHDELAFPDFVSGNHHSWETSQINYNDLNTFEFFCLNKSSVGYAMLQLIKERRIYKRLYVAIRAHMGVKKWQTIKRFLTAREHDGSPSWEGKLNIQRKLQDQLIELIESIEEIPLEFKELIRNHSHQALLLVDMPGDRGGNAKEFEFIVEEDRHRWKTDTLHTEQFDESGIYRAIQNEFHDSIGKLRIFCHPDVFEALRILTRKQIEKCLWKALELCGKEV